MKLYALFWDEPGRHFTLMGVYTSVEKANEAWEVWNAKFGNQNNLRNIVPLQVDDEAAVTEP